MEFIFEIISGFFIDIIFDKLLYGIGWFVLKVLSFGKLPNKTTSELKKEYISVFGIIVILLLMLVIIFLRK